VNRAFRSELIDACISYFQFGQSRHRTSDLVRDEIGTFSESTNYDLKISCPLDFLANQLQSQSRSDPTSIREHQVVEAAQLVFGVWLSPDDK
jgi:hypothetical protein